MRPFTFSSVFATAVLLLAESSSVAAAAEQTYIGCFSSSKPLEDKGSYQYQSNGYCMNLCYGEGKAVFGLHNKDHCLCGDLIPAKSSKESDDSCDTPCAAWPMVKCKTLFHLRITRQQLTSLFSCRRWIGRIFSLPHQL